MHLHLYGIMNTMSCRKRNRQHNVMNVIIGYFGYLMCVLKLFKPQILKIVYNRLSKNHPVAFFYLKYIVNLLFIR